MGYSEKELRLLERSIRSKILKIGDKTLTPKESKIGVFLNEMKRLDEVLYNELISDYKKVLKK